MADPTSPAPKVPPEFAEAFDPARLKKIVIVAGVLVLGVVAWLVVSEFKGSQREGLWEEVARVDLAQDTPDFSHEWLETPGRDATVHERAARIQRLEEHLATATEDPTVTPDVHARVHGLLMEQVIALGDTVPTEDLLAMYDKAEAHLLAIEKFPSFTMNSTRFRAHPEIDPKAKRDVGPKKPDEVQKEPEFDAPTLTRLLLKTLRADREWVKAHGTRPVAPNPDVVALVRTTAGDLSLRFFSDASPALTKHFLDEACAGTLDGTAFFARETPSPDVAYVRGGDARTKKTPATEEDRLTWGRTGSAEPSLPALARDTVSHERGTLSAWHLPYEGDDPTQFVLLTQRRPAMNHEFTPFARADEASAPTLDRLERRQLMREKTPEISRDSARSGLADQFVTPVRIVKVLVYDKGELRECSAARAEANERRLSDVVRDQYLEKEGATPPASPPTPAPPPAPSAMDGDAPPMND